jgi:hypothetical protein
MGKRAAKDSFSKKKGCKGQLSLNLSFSDSINNFLKFKYMF